MTKEFLGDYRKYKLLARFHQGGFKGRIWDSGNKLLTEVNGADLDELVTTLKSYIDDIFLDKANSRTSPPEVAEYIQAFQNILGELPDSYLAMLKAHYCADNRTITATNLAKACGYKNWNPVNLHYGLLGKRLNEELPIQLEKYPNGKPIQTFALATAGDRSQEEAHWQWVMRPEVARAMEQLGLHT